jgi:hypothetical protein
MAMSVIHTGTFLFYTEQEKQEMVDTKKLMELYRQRIAAPKQAFWGTDYKALLEQAQANLDGSKKSFQDLSNKYDSLSSEHTHLNEKYDDLYERYWGLYNENTDSQFKHIDKILKMAKEIGKANRENESLTDANQRIQKDWSVDVNNPHIQSWLGSPLTIGTAGGAAIGSWVGSLISPKKRKALAATLGGVTGGGLGLLAGNMINEHQRRKQQEQT